MLPPPLPKPPPWRPARQLLGKPLLQRPELLQRPPQGLTQQQYNSPTAVVQQTVTLMAILLQ